MIKRYKILLVDDDPVLLEELSDGLVAAGYKVYLYTNGNDALKAVNRLLPDIALIDLKMKDKSGFQVAEELRKINPAAAIPIIAMTGYYTEPEDEKLMKKCGIQACLFKPFSFKVAARKLKSILQSEKIKS